MLAHHLLVRPSVSAIRSRSASDPQSGFPQSTLEIITGHLGGISAEEEDPLRAAADEIERNLRNTRYVRTLALRAGMSPNHVIRSYWIRFGVTPLAFHQQFESTPRGVCVGGHPKCITFWTEKRILTDRAAAHPMR